MRHIYYLFLRITLLFTKTLCNLTFAVGVLYSTERLCIIAQVHVRPRLLRTGTERRLFAWQHLRQHIHRRSRRHSGVSALFVPDAVEMDRASMDRLPRTHRSWRLRISLHSDDHLS